MEFYLLNKGYNFYTHVNYHKMEPSIFLCSTHFIEPTQKFPPFLNHHILFYTNSNINQIFAQKEKRKRHALRAISLSSQRR